MSRHATSSTHSSSATTVPASVAAPSQDQPPTTFGFKNLMRFKHHVLLTPRDEEAVTVMVREWVLWSMVGARDADHMLGMTSAGTDAPSGLLCRRMATLHDLAAQGVDVSHMHVRWRIMRDVLYQLDRMHVRGVTHADIKPDNIVFDPKYQEFRLIDTPCVVGEPVSERSGAYTLVGGTEYTALPVLAMRTLALTVLSLKHAHAPNAVEMAKSAHPSCTFDRFCMRVLQGWTRTSPREVLRRLPAVVPFPALDWMRHTELCATEDDPAWTGTLHELPCLHHADIAVIPVEMAVRSSDVCAMETIMNVRLAMCTPEGRKFLSWWCAMKRDERTMPIVDCVFGHKAAACVDMGQELDNMSSLTGGELVTLPPLVDSTPQAIMTNEMLQVPRLDDASITVTKPSHSPNAGHWLLYALCTTGAKSLQTLVTHDPRCLIADYLRELQACNWHTNALSHVDAAALFQLVQFRAAGALQATPPSVAINSRGDVHMPGATGTTDAIVATASMHNIPWPGLAASDTSHTASNTKSSKKSNTKSSKKSKTSSTSTKTLTTIRTSSPTSTSKGVKRKRRLHILS